MKREADKAIISAAFEDKRIPSNLDKGKQTHNKNKFDNLLEEEIEIEQIKV